MRGFYSFTVLQFLLGSCFKHSLSSCDVENSKLAIEQAESKHIKHKAAVNFMIIPLILDVIYYTVKIYASVF